MINFLLILSFFIPAYSFDHEFKRSPIHKNAFLIATKNDNYAYLIGQPVWSNNWQWTLVYSENHLVHHGTPSAIVSLQQFELVTTSNSVRIKCLLGNSGFLAVKPVSDGSWQWAFFASKEYLEKNPFYLSHFELINNFDRTFSIKIPGKESYLVMDFNEQGQVFFASKTYLDSFKKPFSTSFFMRFESFDLNEP